jgi:50S ribosomal subunit-associated GTPase HflX
MHFFIFHSSHIASAGIAVEVDDSLGNILIGMTYVFATLDAYLSAKSINKKRKGAITTTIGYIPNQGLMASYNMRF